jgi:hypothetical protein
MSKSPTFQFEPETGEVRLKHDGGSQLLFRIKREGVVVWFKRGKTELLVPWPALLKWKQTVTT